MPARGRIEAKHRQAAVVTELANEPEDGGLEVFRATLTAQHWTGPLQQAFKHFLTEHIRFDSDPNQGHGGFCRHLTPDDRVLPLWTAFKHLLIEAAPRLKPSH